ncbi:MAG: ABC-F family ATP-binding cassette domain-containing protein [Planctomycetota bacterium]
MLLSCRDLTRAHNGETLFAGLTFSIQAGERVGLIGANGAGKSTLLRTLAGIERPDGGEVSLARGARLAYLPQEEHFHPEATLEELVAAAAPGDDAEERLVAARIVLGKVGFEDHQRAAGTLSGGWQKRLGLARVLVQQPDLVLLDEPTNHLDLSGVEWLEGLLLRAGFACLVVTHDRFLLEHVTRQVIEIGRQYAEGFLKVEGPYSRFLERREALLDAQQKQERALANAARRELEWLRRGPQGRRTKKKDRIEAAQGLFEDLAAVRTRNDANQATEIGFSDGGRRTRRLLLAEGLSVARGGRTLIEGLDLELQPGDKLGLVGDNGCGKSSLLAVLGEEAAPAAGTIKRAHGLRVVTFHQDRARLDPDSTLLRALCPEGDTISYQGRPWHVSAWAKRFQLDPDRLDMKVGGLSGGERARVLIAGLVRQPADLLLLDEPTNDLDLPTRDVLEESLEAFAGALVVVTHDRFLLSSVCTDLLALDGRGAWRLVADLDQWRRFRREREELARAAEAPAPALKAAPRPRARPGLSSKEKRELEGMEATIEAAEAEVERLEALLATPEVMADHARLHEGYETLHAAQQRVEALYARWEELEAKKASV